MSDDKPSEIRRVTDEEYLEALARVFNVNRDASGNVEPKEWDDEEWRVKRLDVFPAIFTSKLRKLVRMLEEQVVDLRYENLYLREEVALLRRRKGERENE